MKKAKGSTSDGLPSGRRTPISDPPSREIPPRGPLKSFFRTAAAKLSGVFRVFSSRKRSSHSTKNHEAFSSDFPSRPSLPVSSDVSRGSNGKSSSKNRSSFSFSSTSTASSAQVGSIEFTLQEIVKATANFAAANVVGEGAFGTVYKGKLKDGLIVAIKRAHKNIYGQPASAEFRNEVLTLSKIEHLNLVRLYGYLENGDERIIVEEYIGNGSLRDHLDGKIGDGLEIGERLDIATDIAHAVTSLHSYTDPQIIHRDIKASNILITEKLRAKVADFGFARLASEDPGATHISTQVKGSTGYLDPEYLRTYQLSEKSDVYSFGVLLIEMMTGRHPIEPKRQPNERVTIKWAMQKLKQGDAVLVMDWRLRRNPASIMVLEEVLKLARRCIAPTKQTRPSMKKCAEVLWAIRKNYRERTNLAVSSSASPSSANYPTRDVKTQRHIAFGVEEGEGHKFVSA
ncbi:hypothetical protein MLD38_003959 [Melastoma candidum]|uniref:Uncharacterized protein n=1 Tax=Melastoma candidum TaxID=119954 RepID=A0ACB9S3W4_9MYRT|nr:hypothetical protein MLD38_003959 [Melastoma candidum]